MTASRPGRVHWTFILRLLSASGAAVLILVSAGMLLVTVMSMGGWDFIVPVSLIAAVLVAVAVALGRFAVQGPRATRRR